ncbi:ABC transporter permease [Schaedlerella arabinosiphila]|uniref:ABC transporter permease n=1 Tax=Schaedlerella arabinosiphila TaxID=2044587 RepID=UPI002557E736|nr:ABC transporter permease [Schaedlerella arabinosiphila]
MTGSVKKQVKQAVPSMAVLGVMIAAAAILSPTFRNAYNIRNIAAQAAVLSVVAIAQCKVLFIGGIDMSVSSVISFSTILVALFSRDTMHAALFSILLALAAGALTGLINGIGIVTFQIPAMIITISTQAFLKGICLILMPGSGGKVNAEFAAFLKTRIGILNISILLAIAMYILAFFILHYTRFGRNIYAIGNGEVYAEQSGIKVKKNILIVYMISGMIAAFAGVLLSARISTGNPLVGDSYAMDSVAAAVVGGVSMNGGVGSVVGAFFGAVILTLINNIMNNMGISPYFQYIAKGIVLVASLMIFQIKRKEIK